MSRSYFIIINIVFSLKCPPKFTKISPRRPIAHGNCFLMLTPKSFSFNEAECMRIHGGLLARPMDTFENNIISDFAANSSAELDKAWIGYRQEI